MHISADATDTTATKVVDKIEDGIQAVPQKLAKIIAPYVGPHISGYIAKVDIDAPFTITFALLCLIVQILHTLLGQSFVVKYFSVHPFWTFDFLNPLHYIRIFTQVLGHSSWDHLAGK